MLVRSNFRRGSGKSPPSSSKTQDLGGRERKREDVDLIFGIQFMHLKKKQHCTVHIMRLWQTSLMEVKRYVKGESKGQCNHADEEEDNKEGQGQ